MSELAVGYIRVSTTSVNIEDEIEIILHLMDKLKIKWPQYTLAEKVEILRVMTKRIKLGKGTQEDPKEERKAVAIEWRMPWDMLVKYGGAIGGDSSFDDQNIWYARRDLPSHSIDILFSSMIIIALAQKEAEGSKT